jgi:hypothetical protein
MPTLTAQQLEYLRGESQTEIFITAVRPPTLWAATVTGSPAREARAIPFENGAGANFGGIAEYYTVLVGTTAGADDIGRVRVRSATSGDGGVTGTLNIAGNEIKWENGYHLTFLQVVDPWPMYPRIDANEVFYKDYDITYSDQNSAIYPVCIAGPEVQAGFIDDVSGEIVFPIPIGDSYALAPGATITNRTVTVTPSAGVTVGALSGNAMPVTITNPGQYFVKATVTDSNGKVQDSWRWLVAHDPDPASEHYPFTDASSITGQGDWESGGWSAKIRINEGGSLTNFPDKTRVLIWQRPYFNDDQTDVTFFNEGRNTIVCGYLRNADIGRNKEAGGYLDFEIVTLPQILREYRFMFSISLESVGAPDTWWKFVNGSLTAGKIVHHVWRWHSTVFHVCDVLFLLNDGVILRKYAEFEKSDLYNMVNDVIRNQGIYAHLMADRAGRIHMCRDLAYRNETVRNAATIIADITEADTVDDATLTENANQRVAFVFFSGIHYDGIDANPIGSTAPSTWPGPYGSQDMMIERQMLSGQSHSNQMAGQILAVENRRYQQFTTGFHGNYLGVLEPVVMAWWRISLAVADTPREEVITNLRMLVRNVSFDIDVARGTVEVTASFDPEAHGTDGVPYLWPTVVPEIGGDDPGIDTGTNAVLTASSLQRITYDTPEWVTLSELAINDADRDPWWRTKTNGRIGQAIIYLARQGEIRRSQDGGFSSTPIALTNPPNDAGDSPAPTAGNLAYVRYDGNVYREGNHVFLARWQNGEGDWRSWLVRTQDNWATHNWVALPGAGEGESWGTKAIVEAETNKRPRLGNNKNSVMVGSNRVLVAYYQVTGGSEGVFVKVGTIDGNNITFDVPVEIPKVGANQTASRVSAVGLGGGVVAIGAMRGSSAYWELTIVEVDSAGDVTIGDAITVPYADPGDYPFVGVFSMATNNNGYILWYGSVRDSATPSNGQGSIVVIKIVGTTIDDVGTPAAITYRGIFAELKHIGNNKFLYVYAAEDGSTGDFYAYGRIITLNQITMGWDQGNEAQVINDAFTTPDLELIRASITTVQGGDRVVLSWIQVFYDGDNDYIHSLHARMLPITGTDISPAPEHELDSFTTFVIGIDGNWESLHAMELASNDFWILTQRWYEDGSDVINEIIAHRCNVTVNTITVVSTLPSLVGDGGYGYFNPLGFVVGNNWLWTSFRAASVSSGHQIIEASVFSSSGFGAKGDSVKFSRGGGDFIYVTGCDGSQLFLVLFNNDTLEVLADFALGSATFTQFDNKEYWCHVMPVYGNEGGIQVYGRMNNPAGLGNPVHAIYSENGGAFFIVVNDDLGSNYFGAMFQIPGGTVWGIVNRSGAAPQLWRSFIAGLSLSLRTTITTLSDAGANPHSLKQDAWNNIVVASDKPQANMVVYISSPYTGGGTNITYNHPTGSAVNSVIVL